MSVAIYKPFFNNIIKVHQDTAGHPCNRKSFFFFAKDLEGLCTYCGETLSEIYLSSVMLILLVFREHQNAVKKKTKNFISCQFLSI